MWISTIVTPLCEMALVHDSDGRLFAAEFQTGTGRIETSIARFGFGPARNAPAPAHLAQAFHSYFAGDLHALEQLETGQFGSPFERAVWAELCRIPPGETRSYADIAKALGGAASGKGANARAVGMANGRNPLAIVVPCHRVIGSDGGLTGYAAGLAIKTWLLRHEGWALREPRLF